MSACDNKIDFSMNVLLSICLAISSKGIKTLFFVDLGVVHVSYIGT